MRITIAAAVLAGALGALGGPGCAAAIPPLPGKGGPAWLELASEHFTVWTDAGPARGAELMKEIEDLRQVVIGTAFRGAPADGRGFVIAFANDDEVHAYVPEAFSAVTMNGSGPLHAPMIVLSASSNSINTLRTTTHELVHLISYGVIHHQPHWFAEGIAKYFETIQIDAKAGTVDVGRAATARDGSTQVLPHLTSIDAMFACQQMGCMNGNFYATAWALFTYLTNVRPGDLAKLEGLLDASQGDGRAAFAQVFGPDRVAVVDSEMRRWLNTGSHAVLHFNVQLAAHTVRVHPLSDADVLASRALLAYDFHHGPAAVSQALDAALALDPTDVMARVIGLSVARPADPAAARATAAAHPDDWRAWLLVMTAVPPGAEQADARGKVCALAAGDRSAAVPPGVCPAPPPS